MVEHVYALIWRIDTLTSNDSLPARRASRRAGWLSLGILIALVLLPSVALADSGGATINTLPDSYQLEGRVEIQHQCGGVFKAERESCLWYGEASQYPANVECPGTFDLTHSVWIQGGALESGSGTSSGSFSFVPESPEVVLCLYVHDEGEDHLVGQSHPFSTATGSEVLPRPPGRQPTRASLQVRVFDGCKAHVYADARGGGEEERGGSWSDAELRGPSKAKLRTASRKQPWFLTVEGPAGSYRVSMRFDGNATLLPSPLATAAFRLRPCTRGQQG
jgi:hypothetical protein